VFDQPWTPGTNVFPIIFGSQHTLHNVIFSSQIPPLFTLQVINNLQRFQPLNPIFDIFPRVSFTYAFGFNYFLILFDRSTFWIFADEGTPLHIHPYDIAIFNLHGDIQGFIFFIRTITSKSTTSGLHCNHCRLHPLPLPNANVFPCSQEFNTPVLRRIYNTCTTFSQGNITIFKASCEVLYTLPWQNYLL